MQVAEQTSPRLIHDARGPICFVRLFESGQLLTVICVIQNSGIVFMPLRLLVLAAVSSITLFFSGGISLAADLPAADKFDLYLLIGQSNMAGRGVLSKEPQPAPERILKFGQDNSWVAGTEPLHFDKPTIVGAGLGYSFAQEMAKADPTVTIGLIPCAVGGTPLSRWEKGGDLYQQAVERAKLAMAAGRLKGILWHQGEADAGKQETADSYAARLQAMVLALREELKAPEIPFVAGELGRFYLVENGGKSVHAKTVNEQINSLPQHLARSAAVSSEGLGHKGDVVHFDTAALREFGLRYAAAMKTLQKTTANNSGK